MVLLASLFSALLSTIRLNSVQIRIAARPMHTGPDCLQSRLQPSDAASCSHGGNLRNTCLGHPVLQSGKVSWKASGQRKESHASSLRRCWEETLGGHTPPAGLVPLDQPIPSLPPSRKSVHVFSSVTSYYFWIGNPEEFLTEAWRKNKPLS